MSCDALLVIIYPFADLYVPHVASPVVDSAERGEQVGGGVGAIASSSVLVICWMREVSCSMRRRVKAAVTSRRSRVCSGGLWLSM
ncbi:MAG: hypothetical protein ACRDSH_23085 [Pseudonocardiaceae bacterium]